MSRVMKVFLVLVFRVEVGLFISKIFGLFINVCVIVMCCCWFIFNCWVFLFSIFSGSCKVLSSVDNCVLLRFLLLVKCVVNWIFCVIDKCDIKLNCWNIILIWWVWKWLCLDFDSVENGLLSIVILFCVGVRIFDSRFNRVVLFELDLLCKKICLFCFIC